MGKRGPSRLRRAKSTALGLLAGVCLAIGVVAIAATFALLDAAAGRAR